MSISLESWIILFLGFLLSLATAYYFYRKSKKEPIACYAIRGLNIIDIDRKSDIGEKITVSYDGQSIPRLSVGIVSFWNGGTSILDGNTLVQLDPLRISINPDGKILEATIIANPNPQCDCRITFDQAASANSVLITFDFLDQHNGIVVRLLHTAQDETIEVLGTLKGVRLEDEWGSAFAKTYNQISKWINEGTVITAALISATFVGSTYFFEKTGEPELRTLAIDVTPIVLVCLVFASMLIRYLEKKASHKIPKKLKGL